MAKSKPSKAEAEKKEVHLKIKISPEQHGRVKIAAAGRAMSISDFLQKAVLDETERNIAAYVQHEIAKVETQQSSQES